MPANPKKLPPNADDDAEKRKDEIRKSANSYMKYSGLAIQMGIIILIGVYGGMKLDEHFGTDPILTATLALLSTFAALYFSLKDLFINK